MKRLHVLRVVALAGAVLVAGCGNETADAEVRESTSLGGDTMEPEIEVVGDMCETITLLDFPCIYESACVAGDPGKIRSDRTETCDDLGLTCCEGARCAERILDCDEGQVCAYPGAPPTDFLLSVWDVQSSASCVPRDQLCGGPEDLPCASGEYCELAGLLCRDGDFAGGNTCWGSNPGLNCYYASGGGYGTCLPRPTAESCPSDGDAVCGCDGTSYANDCRRKAAGVPLRALGECR